MTTPKSIEINIADIFNKFDVRKALDDDRVLQLATLYVDGIELPPIEVIPLEDGKYSFIDGRHRAAARTWLDLPTIQAVVVKNTLDASDLFARALKSNYGGAKPPSRIDIEHTITRMIEAGCREKDIREKLDFLPPSALRQYLANSKSTVNRRKLRMALDLVANGKSIKQAAGSLSITEDIIRDAISGTKRKWSSGDGTVLGEYKNYISRNMKSATTGITKKIEGLLKKVEDGEAKGVVASQVIDLWEKNLSSTLRRMKDWRERLDQIDPTALVNGKHHEEE